MLANGPFAAPTLVALYATRHEVAALVTRPPRTVHARHADPEGPLRPIATQNNTPIWAPEDINAAESLGRLTEMHPDLLVVCDYGQILSPAALATSRLGGINLHASLLPKYRGAAPINWALYHGEETTGVTVIHMTPGLDAGPSLAQESTPIGPDETAGELEARLATLGAEVVCQVIDELAAGKALPLPQDQSLATRARRLKKTDGEVDWNRPAAAIRNQVRAFDLWPKTFTSWLRAGHEPLRLILGRVHVVPWTGCPVPGTVLDTGRDGLLVAAGENALRIETIQPSGRRMMTVDEFLRGHPIQSGDRLGPGG